MIGYRFKKKGSANKTAEGKSRNRRSPSTSLKGVVVSAYDRGAFLAHQLRREGMEVALWDMTPYLPALSAPEREGPFGVFLPSHLGPLQKKYLYGDNYYPVSGGFSVFNSQGPLEFQGDLGFFFKEERKGFPLCHSVLSSTDSGVFDFSKKENRPLYKDGDRGLLYLSAELTNSHIEPFCFKGPNLLSPLFSDYVLRESSQRYFELLKQSLQEEGVEWCAYKEDTGKNAKKDLRFRKNHVEIQVNDWETSADFLIWTLSGAETQKTFPDWMPLLFPQWEKPVKIWRRFPLLWDQGLFEDIIPSVLFIVPDNMKNGKGGFYLGESGEGEENRQGSEMFLSLKKNPEDSRSDLWILCPYEERFNSSCLSSLLRSALRG